MSAPDTRPQAPEVARADDAVARGAGASTSGSRAHQCPTCSALLTAREADEARLRALVEELREKYACTCGRDKRRAEGVLPPSLIFHYRWCPALTPEARLLAALLGAASSPRVVVGCTAPDFSGNRCRACGEGPEAHGAASPEYSREQLEAMYTYWKDRLRAASPEKA